jgi:hypothetical protein
LATADLIIEVRRLLTIERRAERLICRYLADLADRLRSRSDRELEPFIDEFDAAHAIFGLGTRETRERIRIGRALRQLPIIEHAFIAGDVAYSRVRELTRVAQPDTESDWLELAQSLDMRALERRVASATREAAPARPTGDGMREAAAARVTGEGMREPAAARVTGDGVREAGAARLAGEGVAGRGAGELNGWAGESDDWTVESDDWTSDVDGGAGAGANRSPNDWTNEASAPRWPSPGAEVDAEGPAPRRRVRACTEWMGRDSVRVTFELSAEAWAILERALDGARRRAAVTPVREGEALEGDRHRDGAAQGEGMALGGVALLDDGAALEVLARDALAAQNANRTVVDPRRAVVDDPCDGVSHPDEGVGRLARASASEAAPGCGAPEIHFASEGRGMKGDDPLPDSLPNAAGARSTASRDLTAPWSTSSPRRGSSAEGVARDLERGCVDSIPRATQGGSSTGATACLLQIIGCRGGWTIDDLIDQSGLGVAEVQHALLLLEMADRIRRRCNEIDPT